ncbi:MAG: serine hydrolase, partial [Actinomycetota bacterium]
PEERIAGDVAATKTSGIATMPSARRRPRGRVVRAGKSCRFQYPAPMMRRAVGVVLIVALVSMAMPTTLAGEMWRPRIGKARAYANSRAGDVSFAVVDESGDLRGYLKHRRVFCASVIKVMFMVAYLRKARDRSLNSDDKALLAPMIKRSDNDTATRIADRLGPRPINRLARKARMRNFSYTRPWGSSIVTAADQARLMFRLKRFIPEHHWRYALYLLSHVIGPQRWGVGRVDTSPWRKFFKGGWGSGSGAVDHQVALIKRRNGRRVAIAVMTTDNPSHDYAKRTLRGVFARLLRNLP